jgi:hypothetical protein
MDKKFSRDGDSFYKKAKLEIERTVNQTKTQWKALPID